jgi:hypothetical protein
MLRHGGGILEQNKNFLCRLAAGNATTPVRFDGGACGGANQGHRAVLEGHPKAGKSLSLSSDYENLC